MKFKTITYERSRKADSYSIQTLKLEMTVGEDEDQDAALDWLKARVDNELGFTSEDLKQECQQLRSNKRDLQREIDSLTTTLQQTQERWEKVKAFMEKQGLPVPPDDDIPF